MMDKETGKGLKLFVLDDEKDICHFVKGLFIRRGFEVGTALTGKAAINYINKFSPDIALLDIRLLDKDVDGIQVLKHIREKRPECQCVMVTYMDDEKIVKQAIQLGAVDYLQKPLAFPEVEKVIEKIVKKIRKGAK